MEIRFRALAQVKDTDRYDWFQDVWYDGETVLVDTKHRGILELKHPRCVTQYTGLDDKNGHGIYVGDIVKNEKVFDGVRVVMFNKLMHVSTQDSEGSDYMIMMLDLDTIEVVGNKYENKEMLIEP